MPVVARSSFWLTLAALALLLPAHPAGAQRAAVTVERGVVYAADQGSAMLADARP